MEIRFLIQLNWWKSILILSKVLRYSLDFFSSIWWQLWALLEHCSFFGLDVFLWSVLLRRSKRIHSKMYLLSRTLWVNLVNWWVNSSFIRSLLFIRRFWKLLFFLVLCSLWSSMFWWSFFINFWRELIWNWRFIPRLSIIKPNFNSFHC